MVHVMEWFALYPHLSPQENVWDILSRAVYAIGRQFKCGRTEGQYHGGLKYNSLPSTG